MASIFTRIVNGEIPSYKVAEDEHYYAFLDINPLKKGHTLVIPKQEIDYIFDLDAQTYTGLWQFARRVGVAIEATVPCKRIGIAVVGLEVPHCHVHLVPLDGIHDIDFSKPKAQLSTEEFQQLATDIAANFK